MAADAFRKEAQCTCRPFRIRSCRPLLGRKPGRSSAPAGLLTSTNSLVAPAQGVCLDDGLMAVRSLPNLPHVYLVRAVSTAFASILSADQAHSLPLEAGPSDPAAVARISSRSTVLEAAIAEHACAALAPS